MVKISRYFNPFVVWCKELHCEVWLQWFAILIILAIFNLLSKVMRIFPTVNSQDGNDTYIWSAYLVRSPTKTYNFNFRFYETLLPEFLQDTYLDLKELLSEPKKLENIAVQQLVLFKSCNISRVPGIMDSRYFSSFSYWIRSWQNDLADILLTTL